ncbi:MAG: response regulator transcription factor [Clostridiales bacterium]|jgi:two-component system alkaline phosphatase synthesis response regulator PhoP|nr:response regulator transcription factor [Clostridiales bacterium]
MIYCLEDDNSIRDLMIYTLKASGFEAEGFESSEPFWMRLHEKSPDLIMLDIMLPGEDGLSVLRKLKADSRLSTIPVIITTAKQTEYDKVIGLDTGADDYLAKPYGMMEMVSRIKAVMRRTTPKTSDGCLKNGKICMNIDKHYVTNDGEELILTLKEYELLKVFLEHIGAAFTREKLLRIIWGIEFVGETRTVDVHIGTLRTKLGKTSDCIKTVRGVGYRMEVADA